VDAVTAPSAPKIGDFVWHVHHDKLVEPLTEPFEVRVAYIKANKPEEEIETRLRLMKPVRGHLPILVKARAEWVKADAEWDKARADPSVLALHAKECPNCPWNGATIFPEAKA
jgi:hypothetical protein